MKAAHAVALAVLLAAPVGCRAERDLSLKLNKISQVTSPKAKCIDGTPPAYPLRKEHFSRIHITFCVGILCFVWQLCSRPYGPAGQ